MHSPIPSACFCFLFICFIVSCSSTEDRNPVNDVLDSVYFSPEKVLEIEDSDEDPFGRLNSLDADSRGRIYISDSQTNEIRVYDPDGKLLSKVGRQGSGPGEFESLKSLEIDEENTIWTYDNSRLRISSFINQPDNTWKYDSNISLQQSNEGYPMDVYRSGDGFIVASMRTIENVEQYQQMEIIMSRIDEVGELIDEDILRYIQEEAIIPESGGDFIAIYPIPFNWQTYSRVGTSGKIYVGKSDSLRLEVYNPDGVKVEVIKNRVRYRPVTSSDIEEHGMEPEFPSYKHIPDHHPAFQDFLVDDRDRFWFNLGEWEENLHTWVALNSDGAPVLSAELPERFSVKKIRSGRLYGVYRDEDSKQKIRVYDIPDNHPS